LDLKSSEVGLSCYIKNTILCYRTKFEADISYHNRVTTFQTIPRWRLSAILDLGSSEIKLSCYIRNTIPCYRTKFEVEIFYHNGVTTFQTISRWRLSAILNMVKVQVFSFMHYCEC
jgi:putative transposon-encoded protein